MQHMVQNLTLLEASYSNAKQARYPRCQLPTKANYPKASYLKASYPKASYPQASYPKASYPKASYPQMPAAPPPCININISRPLSEHPTTFSHFISMICDSGSAVKPQDQLWSAAEPQAALQALALRGCMPGPAC